MKLKLFEEFWVQPNVTIELKIEPKERKVSYQRKELIIFTIDFLRCKRFQVKVRITWLVGDNVDVARCYQPTNGFEKLITSFSEVSTFSANRAVYSSVDLKITV